MNMLETPQASQMTSAHCCFGSCTPRTTSVTHVCRKVCLLVACMHPTQNVPTYQNSARLQASRSMQQAATTPHASESHGISPTLVANKRSSVESYSTPSCCRRSSVAAAPCAGGPTGAPASRAAARRSRPWWKCAPPWTPARPPRPAWRRPAWRRPASRAPRRQPGRPRRAPGWHRNQSRRRRRRPRPPPRGTPGSSCAAARRAPQCTLTHCSSWTPS